MGSFEVYKRPDVQKTMCEYVFPVLFSAAVSVYTSKEDAIVETILDMSGPFGACNFPMVLKLHHGGVQMLHAFIGRNTLFDMPYGML